MKQLREQIRSITEGTSDSKATKSLGNRVRALEKTIKDIKGLLTEVSKALDEDSLEEKKLDTLRTQYGVTEKEAGELFELLEKALTNRNLLEDLLLDPKSTAARLYIDLSDSCCRKLLDTQDQIEKAGREFEKTNRRRARRAIASIISIPGMQ